MVTNVDEQSRAEAAPADIAAGRVPLVFFHIGRTGGTSLVNYFTGLARHASVSAFLADRSGLEEAIRNGSQDFVSGHFPVADLLATLPPGWRTMTLIRNPLRHLPSCYWHLRTHGSADTTPELRQLIDACKRYELGELLRQDQLPLFEAHLDNPQARAVLGKETGALDHDDLCGAKRILSRLSFVGVTERIDEFAIQVASSLPWAEWRGRGLGHLMANPRNDLNVYEMPRNALEQIIARTNIDAELYRHAVGLHNALPAPPALATQEAQGSKPPAAALAVADLLRVTPLVLHNARQGTELRIRGNEVLLHPPPTTEGHASVVIGDVPLSGHSLIAGRLVVAHPEAAPVHFSIELSEKSGQLAAASLVSRPGRPVDFRLGTDPVYGSATLTLRTEMSAGSSNRYAWATFVDLSLS